MFNMSFCLTSGSDDRFYAVSSSDRLSGLTYLIEILGGKADFV